MFYKRDKKEILKLAKKIKPLTKTKEKGKNFSKGGIFYILPVDIYEKGWRKNEEPLCKADGLFKLAKIETLHVMVANQFKPSVEEVLQQIPEEFLDTAVGFTISSKQQIEVAGEEADQCFMKAQTTLYGLEEGKKLPPYVEKQYVIMGENVVQWDDEVKSL